MVVTIKERRDREVARLVQASREVMDALKAYAVSHQGRFRVFGSVARGELQLGSDFDVVVDFPDDRERQAIAFVEEACHSVGLTADIHTTRDLSPRLQSRVLQDGVVLP